MHDSEEHNIILSLPLFLSTGKQIHFDCSDVSRILPECNMSGLKSPDKKCSRKMIKWCLRAD